MKHDTEVHVIDNLSSGFKEYTFVNNEHIYIKDITDFEFVTQLIQKNNLILSFI